MNTAEAPTHRAEMRSGFRWSFATTLVQGLLQVAVTMTMARILAPAEYGIYAMVEVVIRWANIFGQTGLVTVLVQRHTVEEEDWRAARILALGYSTAAFVVVALGAPLIAAGFGNTSITNLLRVASLSFLINGMGLTSLAALRRKLQFGKVGIAELAGYILGNGVTAITLAKAGAGVWSVVFGNLVSQFVQNAVAFSQARPARGFTLPRAKIAPMVRDSAHVSVNSILDVFNNTMDTFVIARVMAQTVLGSFNRASMLASLPANFLWSAVGKVTLPGYARLQHDPGMFFNFFRQTKAWTSTITVAVPLSMIPAAEPIVRFLLGKGWLGVIPILKPLLLGFAFESLAVPYHSALDALGKYTQRSKIRIATLIVRASLLGLIVCYHWSVLFYVSAAIGLFTWLISVFPLAARLEQSPYPFFLNDIKILARACLCCLAVFVAHSVLIQWNTNVAVDLLGCIVAGAICLGAFFIPEISAWTRKRPHTLAAA